MRCILILLTAAMLMPLSAYDFQTKSGKIYRGAGIGRISSSGIELILKSGIELLPLEDVPEDLIKVLSPSRQKRFYAALEKYRALPPEIKEKDRKKQDERKRIVAEGWKMHRNLELWLKAFSVARAPGEDACLFAVMARSFRREFQAAEDDKERAAVFTAFLKKVKESGITGEIKLDIPKPTMPQHRSPRGNYPINPPRGARAYKVNGKEVRIR